MAEAPAHSDGLFRFCFTLDTEPDALWANPPVMGFEHFDRLVEFHHRLVDAGARPTYLTTSEVVESEKGRSALQQCVDEGSCEIGAHFHTWTRRWPFDVPDLGAPPLHAMAHRLGQEIEESMLRYTCASIQESMGIVPRSFRGGRWSHNEGTVQSLANCGIRVDSTVTPGISWRDTRNPLLDGPDFGDAPMHPYRLQSPGNGKEVIELPVGSAYFPHWARPFYRSEQLHWLARKVGRISSLRIGLRWLRPTSTSSTDMHCVMKWLRSMGCPVWVFMIHSSEIVPNTKLPSEAKVRAFVERCEEAVRFAVDLGASGATLTEAADWVVERGLQLETRAAG